MAKPERDIEKDYPLPDFIDKLRRLADALEQGKRFEIQVAGERIYVPARAQFNIEHDAARTKRKSSSRSSGRRSDGLIPGGPPPPLRFFNQLAGRPESRHASEGWHPIREAPQPD